MTRLARGKTCRNDRSVSRASLMAHFYCTGRTVGPTPAESSANGGHVYLPTSAIRTSRSNQSTAVLFTRIELCCDTNGGAVLHIKCRHRGVVTVIVLPQPFHATAPRCALCTLTEERRWRILVSLLRCLLSDANRRAAVRRLIIDPLRRAFHMVAAGVVNLCCSRYNRQLRKTSPRLFTDTTASNVG